MGSAGGGAAEGAGFLGDGDDGVLGLGEGGGGMR